VKETVKVTTTRRTHDSKITDEFEGQFFMMIRFVSDMQRDCKSLIDTITSLLAAGEFRDDNGFKSFDGAIHIEPFTYDCLKQYFRSRGWPVGDTTADKPHDVTT
jgi:hypothetical protein